MGRIPFVLAMLLLFAVSAAGAETATDYQRGLDLLKQKQYEQAVSVFEGIASASPAYAPRSHLQIGRCFRLMGQASDAIDRFLRAIQLASSRAESATVVETKTDLADTYYSGKDLDAALRICLEPGQLDSERGKHLLTVIYLDKKDYAKSLVALDDLLVSYPNAPRKLEYHLTRAECLAGMGRHDDALAAVQKLLLDYPTTQATTRKPGKVLMSLLYSAGDVSRLCDVVLPALSDSPECAELRFTVGLLTLVNAGRPTDARAILNSLADASGFPPGQIGYYLAQCSMREDDWPRARTELEKLLEGAPAVEYAAPAIYHLGLCCLELKDDAGARAAFERTVKEHPGSQWAGYASRRLEMLSRPPKGAPVNATGEQR